MSFPYDHPLRPFLLALRSQVIPAALLPFLYEIEPPIAFVDGCLVVQVNDYRRAPEPVFSRVVMRPAAEGLAQTIDLVMQQKGEPWDDQFALEAESRIIVRPLFHFVTASWGSLDEFQAGGLIKRIRHLPRYI